MAVISGLIREENDGTLSFGDYTLKKKTKIEEYPYKGDVYKIKTFREVTKLKKNGNLVYESSPGTVANNLSIAEDGASFSVEGQSDAMVTLGMLPETEYDVALDGKDIGRIKTNFGGKLSFGVELTEGSSVDVKVTKA